MSSSIIPILLSFVPFITLGPELLCPVSCQFQLRRTDQHGPIGGPVGHIQPETTSNQADEISS
jgi:hypothetical protein